MSLELLEVQLLQKLKVHVMSRKEKKVMPILNPEIQPNQTKKPPFSI